MQIVIEIPEDVYTRLFDSGIQDNEIAVDDVCEMARALRLGTPLPKGHGKIIDVADLLDRICLDDTDENREDNVGEIVTLEDIDFIPAIIEADGGEEDADSD